MRFRPFGIRLLHPKPVPPPATEEEASELEPQICPECETPGIKSDRGYYCCPNPECGVSW